MAATQSGSTSRSRIALAHFACVAAGLGLAAACVPTRDAAPPSPPAMASESPPPVAQAPSASVAPPADAPAPVAAPIAAGPELPRGGRTLFPDYRLVGFCGTPGAPALGQLLDHPAAKAEKLMSYANQYGAGRKIMPVFELIAVVVQAGGGPDGKNRVRVLDSTVDDYLAAARQTQGLLLLNIQPGHSDFLTEVQRFEKYLHMPDVGVALDPEWAMLPKQAPGHFYGQTTADAINSVIAYLAQIVTHDNLPEKALVFHEVNDYVVKGELDIKPQPVVVAIKSVDGLGPKGAKLNTYHFLMRTTAPGVHPGFKLFFDEDRQNGAFLMSPAEVLAITPQPEYVMYE
jgi:hypothetical protein